MREEGKIKLRRGELQRGEKDKEEERRTEKRREGLNDRDKARREVV